MIKGKLRMGIEYPRKCKHCPKILESGDQEDKHYKRHHLK